MIIDITDSSQLDCDKLNIYLSTSETRLLHYFEPDLGIFIAESPLVIGRALDAGYQPISVLMEAGNINIDSEHILARLSQIPVYRAVPEIMQKITGYKLTRGMLCAMKRKPLPSVTDICKGKRRIAILENVVNPTNVGAIVRSAAALGMEAVLLSPGSCDPLYRRAIRVSMGTIFQIPWTYIGDSISDWPASISLVQSLGFKTAAMALSENSVSIDDGKLTQEEKLAVLLGSEGPGLMEETIKLCDYTVKIPMSHGVDSLNVAAASAVAFWQLSR